MSDSEDSGGPGRREVAHRLFAAEFEDADLSYADGEEERAPNYVVTPSGARVNRLFVVGVLTEVSEVSDGVLRARVVDPTGAFVLYAGQYQPDEQAFLDRAEPPLFVALTGKARTFQPDDADTVYTSVRPESVNEVDAETRDRWVVTAAERTLDRVGRCASAAATGDRGDALRERLRATGHDDATVEGVVRALDHYDTTGDYLQALRDLALDAAEVVAGRREEVRAFDRAPDAGGDEPLAALAETDTPAATASAGASGTDTESAGAAAATTTESDPTPEPSDPGGEEETPVATAGGGTDPDPDSEPGPGPASAGETTSAGRDAEDPTGSVEDATTQSGATGADTEADAETGEVGDFESGGLDDDVGEFEPEEFELDPEEREEIESEYGTDFQSGAEVDEPGAADIETPDPDPDVGADGETDAEADAADADTGAVEPDPEPESDPDPEPAAATDTPSTEETATTADESPGDEGGEESVDVEDLEDAVVELMGELDDGDGVERATLVETATDRFGVEESAVEEAVQDALMGGRCYEPDDTTLKPI